MRTLFNLVVVAVVGTVVATTVTVLIAVSYTHLDVYKRQVPLRSDSI